MSAKPKRPMLCPQDIDHSILGYGGTNWDGLGQFGLTGRYAKGQCFGADSAEVKSEAKTGRKHGHGVSKVYSGSFKQYTIPRLASNPDDKTGKRYEVSCSYKLKERMVSTGVYFSADEVERPVEADSPEKEYVLLSEEKWDRNVKRVRMYGNVSGRFHSSAGKREKGLKSGVSRVCKVDIEIMKSR